MKVKVTDVRVTDDLYLFMQVDAGGKVGEYSYNIIWEEVNDLENIDHATEISLDKWCGDLCWNVLSPIYREAAEKMREAVYGVEIELEV